MKERLIKSLIKSGLKKVSFDNYLSTTETNIFAISDRKGLFYMNISGKNYVMNLEKALMLFECVTKRY